MPWREKILPGHFRRRNKHQPKYFLRQGTVPPPQSSTGINAEKEARIYAESSHPGGTPCACGVASFPRRANRSVRLDRSQALRGDEGYIPDASMDTAETRRLIMEIVDELPEDQRLCVMMHYYDELPLAEIAAALDVPMGTVKKRLYLARNKISDGVENLEKKQGVKLYGAAPIPLLIWLLKNAAGESAAALPPFILGSSAVTATGAAAASASTATGGIFAGAALTKIIVAAAAVVAIAGGVGTAVALLKKPPAATAATTIAAATSAADADIAADAAALSGAVPPASEDISRTAPMPDTTFVTIAANAAATTAEPTSAATAPATMAAATLPSITTARPTTTKAPVVLGQPATREQNIEVSDALASLYLPDPIRVEKVDYIYLPELFETEMYLSTTSYLDASGKRVYQTYLSNPKLYYFTSYQDAMDFQYTDMEFESLPQATKAAVRNYIADPAAAHYAYDLDLITRRLSNRK